MMMDDVLQSLLGRGVFARLIEVSWQASVLAVLIVTAQWVLRKQIGATWRHALWGLLLVRLLLPWTVPTPVSLFNLMRWNGAEQASMTAGFDTTPFAAPIEQPQPVEESTARYEAPLTMQDFAVPIWLVGVTGVVGFALVQGLRLRRQLARRRPVTDPSVLSLLEDCKQRMGVKAAVTAVVAPHIEAPALMGFVRPCLLLPKALVEAPAHESLRYVLLHELAHVRRRDILTGWIAYLALSLHWFNPILWWAMRRSTADRELACDARVLSALGHDERRAYGHALLDQVQRLRRPVWAPALAGVLEGNTNMERRIVMIATFANTSRKGTALALAALVILGGTALTSAQEKPANTAEAPAVAAVAPQDGIGESVPAVEETRSPNTAGTPVATSGKPKGKASVNKRTSASPLRLALCNRKQVYDNYDKQKTEMAALKEEVKSRQSEIEALSTNIESARQKYQTDTTLSPDEKSAFEEKMKADLRRYQSVFKELQSDIDSRHKDLIKRMKADIDAGVEKVAADKGFDAVLDSDPDRGGTNSVIWSRTEPEGLSGYDITPAVIEYLNKQ